MKSRWLSLWHIRPFYNKSLARNLHVLFIDQNFNSSSPSIERSTLSWNPLSLLNLDNQYIINPLSLHAILNFSFFFRYISFRFISFCLISFRFFRYISFRFVAFRFVSLHFVSFRFDRFRFVSIGFVSFRSVSFYFVWFRFVRFRFVSISFRTLQVPIPSQVMYLCVRGINFVSCFHDFSSEF